MNRRLPDLHFYGRDGKRITRDEWIAAFEDTEGRTVGRDEIGEGDGAFLVSTVWLGLDHGWGRGAPLIFETMVFPSDYQRRYSTEREARQGHRDTVAMVKRQALAVDDSDDPRGEVAGAKRRAGHDAPADEKD